MSSSVERMHARARPDAQMDQLFGDGWPDFITADQLVKRYIGAVRELFADLELVLLDPSDVLVAAGWGCQSSGTVTRRTFPRGTPTPWYEP